MVTKSILLVYRRQRPLLRDRKTNPTLTHVPKRPVLRFRYPATTQQ